MVILYEIAKDGKADQLVYDPFTDEVNDMAPFIIENISLLSENEELHFLKKETTHGKTGERQDILALDDNGRLVIIELKRDYADEKIESQIRGYWRTLRENPDTIRNYCNGAKNNLSDINYDSNIEPKVIVVAPEISDDWVKSASELNLDINFIEVKRFKKGSQTYVSVNDKESKPVKRPRESTSREDYDWEHYSRDLNWHEDDVKILQDLREKIKKFIDEQGMDMHIEFKKMYIPFKHGRRIVLDFSTQKRKIYLRLNVRLKAMNAKIDGKPLEGMEPGWYLNERKQFELEFDRNSVPEFSLLEEPIKMAYALT